LRNVAGIGKAVHTVRLLFSRVTDSVEVGFRTASTLALVALLGGTSCGVRTAVSAEADWEDEKDGGGKVLACGYGPPCNPRNFDGKTCTSLGLQPGTLSCDPETCFLVLTGCGKGTAGAGGNSSGRPMPGAGATPLMDAGPLFGGLFGGGTGAIPGGGTGAIPGGLPMDDEDGGMPGFFGNGFFGGNPGMGFFGGNPGTGFFGGQNQGQGGAGQDQDPDAPN
jgi:hypothetical protein